MRYQEMILDQIRLRESPASCAGLLLSDLTALKPATDIIEAESVAHSHSQEEEDRWGGGSGEREQDVVVQAAFKVRRQLGCLWTNQLAGHGTWRPGRQQVVIYQSVPLHCWTIALHCALRSLSGLVMSFAQKKM